MPTFAYKAKSGPTNVISGFIQADNLALAVAKLTQSGQTPFEIKPSEEVDEVTASAAVVVAKASSKRSQKVTAPALVYFTRQLADLIDAGIPLLRAIELTSKQAQFTALLPITNSIHATIQQGGSLSSALGKHPQIFSGLYVNTVKAAEESGQLPQVLDRLAGFLEQDLQLKSRVTASLLYPAIILVVGIVTIFVLFSFVLPRMTTMFEDFGAELPLITQIVAALSGFFFRFWWLIAGIFFVGFMIFRQFLLSPAGKSWLDAKVFQVPLVNSFIQQTLLSRFARTLGMLLESGVPVVLALESVSGVLENEVMQKEVKTITTKVKGGISLAQAVGASKFFPPVAIDLIAIGQESGRLERGLYKLAAATERSSQETAQTFVTILGPAVLITVVSIVGVVIIAILIPMFQMNAIVH